MAARNTLLRYGGVAMAFHWLIAALIVTNIALGLWFGEFMAHQDALRFPVVQIHKSIGLTVLVLSVLRLGWRLINPVPALPRGMSAWMRVMAHLSHFTLYFLMIVIPLTGWLLVSASPLGNPTNYFWLFGWPNLPFFTGMTRAALHPLHDLFGTTHVVLAWLSIAAILLHVGAALYHHFLRRDDVLRRMLPGTQVSDMA
ncbi:MAG TPA: cytochrome b [Rhizomicrobium sp.]|jgi:cytochrome b561|nr:cytochrome b [Rhizomicrobium sp.]